MKRRYYYETEETITRKKKGWMELDTEFTQVYHCFNDISAKINSPTSFKLMFWLLANEAGKYNGILSTEEVYKRFNTFLIERCPDCAIAYRTFSSCMKELKDAGALTQAGKGHYYFNPFIFWNDTDKERKIFIEAEKKEGTVTSFNPNAAESDQEEEKFT